MLAKWTEWTLWTEWELWTSLAISSKLAVQTNWTLLAVWTLWIVWYFRHFNITLQLWPIIKGKLGNYLNKYTQKLFEERAWGAADNGDMLIFSYLSLSCLHFISHPWIMWKVKCYGKSPPESHQFNSSFPRTPSLENLHIYNVWIWKTDNVFSLGFYCSCCW